MYGKYGFRPVKHKDGKIIINKQFNESYEYNKNKMKILTVKQINLIKYFIGLKNFSEEQFEHVKHVIDKYPDMLAKDFLKKFLKDFDKTCIYFIKFYVQLYDDIHFKSTDTFFGKFI